MRTLLLLRGAPGCGKSTWIDEHGLRKYALSADELRIMCQSKFLQSNGQETISAQDDGFVWSTLFDILERRMQHGQFTVVDATNSQTKEINKYKNLCEKYRYRLYCVDFTQIPIEEVKRRNANRFSVAKRVPNEAIDKMYARFDTQKIPSGITVIQTDEFDKLLMKPLDLSQYKKIHHIGDIHGCYTVLQQYLNSFGGIKDDEFYIFTGDYIDRGIENAKMVKFLFELIKKKNVLLLEGNHEKWLHSYGIGEPAKSLEFEQVTRLQLENAGISRKEIRALYRKFAQCAYYTYHGNVYLVTHGGISNLDDNLLFTSTEQMIHGVGNYQETELVDAAFVSNTPDNTYQIHGHRNVENTEIHNHTRTFNLEGKVELGDMLRCVQITPDDYICVETENTVYKKPLIPKIDKEISDLSIEEVISLLRANPYIKEKSFDNISSFNFTSQVFFKSLWNDQTIKSRGLFIDTKRNKIVARSYDKFFNINERPETHLDYLQSTMKFPATAYVKENGFLGIVSYNMDTDDLFIASKSTPTGPYANYFKNMIYQTIPFPIRRKMQQYMKDHHVSFVFECVDIKNDPHIIDYDSSQLYLLNIIHNEIKYNPYSYKEICTLAKEFSLTPKEKACEFTNWHEFYEWYKQVTAEDYLYHNRNIEGFVIEDAEGTIVKLKLAYYLFWKQMRNIATSVEKYGIYLYADRLQKALANEFYGWIRNLYQTQDPETIPKNIIELRKMFFKEYKC